MSIDLGDIDSFDDDSSCLDWAFKTGIWNGRVVSRLEAPEFENTSHSAYKYLVAQLAWAGSGTDRLLLAKDIQALDLSKISKDLQPLAVTKKSWIYHFLETIGRGMIDPDLLNPETDISLTPKEQSSRFTTSGIQEPHLRIGGINGMNTSFDGALSHANYMARFASHRSIDWVYNCSHGLIVDLAEIFALNFLGSSPNTRQLLQENWASFHEQNANKPHAKYLQFCHSQGAIHVRNALAHTPKEIRDRVIVVAIAPGAIVPDELCYQSFNYASKKDILPHGELAFAGAFDTNEYGTSKVLEAAIQNHEQLIMLEPHPDAVGFDHDYQSPTFRAKIIEHLTTYLNNNGEYE